MVENRAELQPTREFITCQQCGQKTPNADFCTQCGSRKPIEEWVDKPNPQRTPLGPTQEFKPTQSESETATQSIRQAAETSVNFLKIPDVLKNLTPQEKILCALAESGLNPDSDNIPMTYGYDVAYEVANTNPKQLLEKAAKKLSLLWALSKIDPMRTDTLKVFQPGVRIIVNFAADGISFDEPINELFKAGKSGIEVLEIAHSANIRRPLFAPILEFCAQSNG